MQQSLPPVIIAIEVPSSTVEDYDSRSVEAHVRSIEDEWEEDWQNNPREKFFDKMLDRLEEKTAGTLHSLVIPPKDSAGCRDWNSESQQRWVRRVRRFTFVQVCLTWLLFYMSMYHYREMRMTKSKCVDGAVLVTNQTGVTSIAATCPTAALDSESRVTLKDPLYEAALNYTRPPQAFFFEDGYSDWDFYFGFLQESAISCVLTMFHFLFFGQKTVHSLMMMGPAGGRFEWNKFANLFVGSNQLADVFSETHWDLVSCGAMLLLLVIGQVTANLGITLVAWNSGESLFNTVLTTFVLTKVAEMDGAFYNMLGIKRDSKAESEAAHRTDKLRKLRSNPALRTSFALGWFGSKLAKRLELSCFLSKALRSELKKATKRWNKKYPLRKKLQEAITKRWSVMQLLSIPFLLIATGLVHGAMQAAAAIFIAVHDLPSSEFTRDVLSIGSDYRDSQSNK